MGRKRDSEEAGVAVDTESKADKFRRLGNRRLINTVKSIRALARLGNRRAYDRTAEQTELLFETLGRAWDRLKQAFNEEPPELDGETRYF